MRQISFDIVSLPNDYRGNIQVASVEHTTENHILAVGVAIQTRLIAPKREKLVLDWRVKMEARAKVQKTIRPVQSQA